MDFSSWQTWGLIALGVVAILWLIGTIFGDKNVAEPAPYTQSKPHATLPTQVAMMAAMTATSTGFDRDMYIDDMTEEQLEDEHVLRTAFVTCHSITAPCGPTEKHPANKINAAITGKPFDQQLFGLTDYYLETAFEGMMAEGEDRYWDEELIAGKDQWSLEKREQILLAALVPLARAHDIYVAVRKTPPGPNDTGAHLVTFIDRVADAFFGDDAQSRMAALRAQAGQLASMIEL